MVHVGCYNLCCVLLNLTSDVVPCMDWLHAINPRIDWNAYSLSLDCGYETVYILGTKQGFSHTNVNLCALKLLLKVMHSDKISAWFGILQP